MKELFGYKHDECTTRGIDYLLTSQLGGGKCG